MRALAHSTPWHHVGMSAAPLHRPPRYPHAWWLLLALSQCAVALLWWRYGWRIGLPALVASHLLLLWGVLRPQSRLYSPVLTRLPINDQSVWLTIDDGPSGDTWAMLDLLDRYAAKATFFLVAKRARAQPELAREIVRRGHGIGNHSATHPQAWFWALGPVRMAREIDECQEALTQITGIRPRWFRAVVGMANPFVSVPLRKHGLTRVAWSARGYDAVTGDAAAVMARIEKDLKPGAIVLLHEGARHGGNLRTLELLLLRLRALGYATVLPERLQELDISAAAPRSANC